MSAAAGLELVVGGDGFIGARLAEISGARKTSRRTPLPAGCIGLDLLALDRDALPPVGIVYLCAGVNGALPCEGNPQAWRVNVDATIALTEHYVRRGSFVVWIGSTAVEWSGTAYARHKLTTETVLRTLANVAIVRAGRITQANVEGLCRFMIGLGRRRIEGLKVWESDAAGSAT